MRTIEYQYKKLLGYELTQVMLLFMFFGLLAWMIDITNATLLYAQIFGLLVVSALLRFGLKYYWLHSEPLSFAHQQLMLRGLPAKVSHSSSWLNRQTLLVRSQDHQASYCVRIERAMISRSDWVLLEQLSQPLCSAQANLDHTPNTTTRSPQP